MSKIFAPDIESERSKKLAQSQIKMEDCGSETILVAEDDASLRILTCRILHNHGYKVLEAADGNEALLLAEEFKEKIDLILTDTVMPGMNGRDAVERIKAFRPGIKSIFMSGYTDTTIIELGLLNKNTAFLQKPYDVAGLTQKVRAVLDSDH